MFHDALDEEGAMEAAAKEAAAAKEYFEKLNNSELIKIARGARVTEGELDDLYEKNVIRDKIHNALIDLLIERGVRASSTEVTEVAKKASDKKAADKKAVEEAAAQKAVEEAAAQKAVEENSEFKRLKAKDEDLRSRYKSLSILVSELNDMDKPGFVQKYKQLISLKRQLFNNILKTYLINAISILLDDYYILDKIWEFLNKLIEDISKPAFTDSMKQNETAMVEASSSDRTRFKKLKVELIKLLTEGLQDYTASEHLLDDLSQTTFDLIKPTIISAMIKTKLEELTKEDNVQTKEKETGLDMWGAKPGVVFEDMAR